MMIWFATVLVLSNLVWLVAVIMLSHKLRKFRHRLDRYKLREDFVPGPIQAVEIQEFDPRFKVGATGPSASSDVRFIPSYQVRGSINELESWIICNFAKTAERIFEFGTCTGKTTFLMAANSPSHARISTLTLAPEQISTYQAAPGDADLAQTRAVVESAFAEFLYAGTPESAKIEQLFLDSKAFDESSHLGKYDLILIDGSHAQSYVESDTAKALKMVKPGGIIFWHDYRGPKRTPGVFITLNALSERLPLYHINGTSLVAYRYAPVEAAESTCNHSRPVDPADDRR